MVVNQIRSEFDDKVTEFVLNQPLSPHYSDNMSIVTDYTNEELYGK